MDYNELKNLAKQRNLSVKDIATRLNVSINGFKVSFENGTMPFSKVPELCILLGITCAQFFGEDEIEPTNKAVSYQQSGNCNMIASEGGKIGANPSEVQFLREQVRELTRMNSELIKKMK